MTLSGRHMLSRATSCCLHGRLLGGPRGRRYRRFFRSAQANAAARDALQALGDERRCRASAPFSDNTTAAVRWLALGSDSTDDAESMKGETSGRAPDELRPVRITRGFTRTPKARCWSSSATRVLCTASVEDGVPPFLRGQGQGWVTAEYGMLPRATTHADATAKPPAASRAAARRRSSG